MCRKAANHDHRLDQHIGPDCNQGNIDCSLERDLVALRRQEFDREVPSHEHPDNSDTSDAFADFRQSKKAVEDSCRRSELVNHDRSLLSQRQHEALEQLCWRNPHSRFERIERDLETGHRNPDLKDGAAKLELCLHVQMFLGRLQLLELALRGFQLLHDRFALHHCKGVQNRQLQFSGPDIGVSPGIRKVRVVRVKGDKIG